MGYAGSSGLEPQQFVSNNQPCGYICYGFGEFDGQNSGHDFSGNVSARALFLVLVPNPGTKISRSVRGSRAPMQKLHASLSQGRHGSVITLPPPDWLCGTLLVARGRSMTKALLAIHD